MNLTEIKKSLERQFARELMQGSKRNIVFWYDEDGAYADDIDSLVLDGVKTIKLDNNNMFAVKLYIEVTDRENHLLIYSPMPRPTTRENWLADTIKYSQTFSADETTNNMRILGIATALRSVMEKYKLFFRNNERFKKFEAYCKDHEYTEMKIDLAVHSALCKLSAPSIDHIVQVLLTEFLSGQSSIIDNIEKFGNLEALWSIISKAYSYAIEEKSLEKLAILLLCTHLSHTLNGSMSKEWQEYVSQNSNCFVFVDNFMKNTQLWEQYNNLAKFVSGQLGLETRCYKWTINEIIECDTFEDFDKAIITRIRENIIHNAGEYEHYRKIINSRKNRRYYQQFAAEYETLHHACEYLDLAKQYATLPGRTAFEMLENYTKKYFRLDSCYRHFIYTYDQLTERDDYEPLFELIENSYTNWFLNELSIKWCTQMKGDWKIPGITPQQRFFEQYADRFIKNDDRIVIIVSDALRYETAFELNTLLNREQSGTSELEHMLGVLPSYTALGMAALLPHKSITITEQAEVVVDGISSRGTDNRTKILKNARSESVAVQYDDVMRLNKTQASKLFAGIKLVYIYHNTIDARGDNAATENEVFEAANKALDELNRLVRKLRNDISAINILITADHGFLYRRTKLEERDKTSKENAAGILSKRRFILAEENIEQQGTLCYSMDYLLEKASSLFALIPRATNCFKVQGAGSCYVHGGMSLQEIVVPVICFRSDKNLKSSMRSQKVSLALTNLSRKITSVITHLSFYQEVPVDEKHLPLRVTAYFINEEGYRISNENIIIAESTSKKPEERTYKEKFTLKNITYDKSKTYYLVLTDEDETVNREIEQIPFVIDLVFGNSMQF